MPPSVDGGLLPGTGGLPAAPLLPAAVPLLLPEGGRPGGAADAEAEIDGAAVARGASEADGMACAGSVLAGGGGALGWAVVTALGVSCVACALMLRFTRTTVPALSTSKAAT